MSGRATPKPGEAREPSTDLAEQVCAEPFAFHAVAPFLELLPVSVAVFDVDERLVLCNESYRADQGPDIAPHLRPGIRFEEMIDLHVHFRSYARHSDGSQGWRNERLAAFRGGDAIRFVDRPLVGWYVTQDRRLPNGYTMIVGTDISHVNNPAEKLEELSQRLTDYVRAASDWFWETDVEHRFTYISDRVTEATGMTPGEFLGRDRRDLALKSRDGKEWATHLADLEAHRPFRDFRYSTVNARGEMIVMSTSGQPFYDADGRFLGYRGTGFNATREVEGQRTSDRLLEAIENVNEGYSLWDREDKLILFNSRWREIVSPMSSIPIANGMGYEDMIRDHVMSGAFPAATDDPEGWIRERVRRHRHSDEAFEQSRGDGRWLLVKERATPEGGVLQILTDISDLKRREIALRQSEERFKGFAESAADWFWELDRQFRITFLSARYEQLTGTAISSLNGQPFSSLASNDAAHQIAIVSAEKILRAGEVLHDHEIHASGEQAATLVHSLSGQAIRNANGVITGYRGTGRDVTQARLLSLQLAHQASHDELTGLVNRRGFEQRLARAMESTQHGRGQYALCYMDLDQFKVVNDSCGHAAGDELLRQLARVLQNKVRGRDTVARFGGDEFALLLENCTLDEARPVADSLRAAVEDFSFIWEDKQFRLGASIGLVMLRAEVSMAEVMRAADSACYLAKDQGRNRIHVYEPDDKEQSRREREMDWVVRINEALAEERFILYGQRIRASKPSRNASVHHHEILIRLREKDGQIVTPGAFLPAAERFGLATRIDRWVVRQTFDLLERSPQLVQKGNFLSINLSGQSLGDADFCAYVVHQLRERDIRGENICFEITETAAIADLSAAQNLMRETAALGCHFALDDFGTGLSSFAYLRDLAVEYVKIDGAFIKDIESDPIHRAMVQSIHDIAKVLGKKTIAEFVANESAAALLAEIGVDYVQGFGIGKPAPLHELLGE